MSVKRSSLDGADIGSAAVGCRLRDVGSSGDGFGFCLGGAWFVERLGWRRICGLTLIAAGVDQGY